MLNIDKIEHVYLAIGITDLRKSIDGLSAIVNKVFKLNPYEKAMFVFCNRSKDKIKILHWDNGFWLYYYRLEKGKFKWIEADGSNNNNNTLDITLEEFSWILKGYEARERNKLRMKKEKIYY